MPVLPEFYVSHQWLRELKRGGAKNYVGIYFKVDSEEMTWFGKYNEKHQYLTIGKAIAKLMKISNPLGYELFIERKIEAKEIFKIRSLSQTLGWRYMPNSHEREPTCVCPMCVPRGTIKSNRLRQKVEPKIPVLNYNEIIQSLETETNEDKIESLLWDIRRKKRGANPQILFDLLKNSSVSIQQSLALTLGYYQHPRALVILLELCQHSDSEVREYSAESIFKLKKLEAIEILNPFQQDAIIQKVIQENEEDLLDKS